MAPPPYLPGPASFSPPAGSDLNPATPPAPPLLPSPSAPPAHSSDPPPPTAGRKRPRSETLQVQFLNAVTTSDGSGIIVPKRPRKERSDKNSKKGPRKKRKNDENASRASGHDDPAGST
ncbi:hypothetical protein FKP32DRAFT_1676073 [Trametes sanguinea]|nr:hypothetical protein FKP32DRAFT_1676073 [Trametes sanguinea]